MSARSLVAELSVALIVLSLGAPSRARGEKREMSSPLGPLSALAASFAHTISVKNRGRLVEFCPDNTCDGFVASSAVPIDEVQDFAYLYEYFFSQYTYLPEWRSTSQAKTAAERVLSKPEYQGCKNENHRDAAKCVLLRLNRTEKIKLIFVRYDEGARNVVAEDVTKEVSR